MGGGRCRRECHGLGSLIPGVLNAFDSIVSLFGVVGYNVLRSVENLRLRKMVDFYIIILLVSKATSKLRSNEE